MYIYEFLDEASGEPVPTQQQQAAVDVRKTSSISSPHLARVKKEMSQTVLMIHHPITQESLQMHPLNLVMHLKFRQVSNIFISLILIIQVIYTI